MGGFIDLTLSCSVEHSVVRSFGRSVDVFVIRSVGQSDIQLRETTRLQFISGWDVSLPFDR